MSWSIVYAGPSNEAAAVVKREFEAMSPCPEPEESIKQKFYEAIMAALASNRARPGYSLDINLTAFGSQSTYWNGTNMVASGYHNTVNIKIEVDEKVIAE